LIVDFVNALSVERGTEGSVARSKSERSGGLGPYSNAAHAHAAQHVYINCYQPTNLCDHLHLRNKPNDSIMKKKVAPGVVIPPSHSMSDLPSGQSAAPLTKTSKVFGSKRSQRSTNDASMATELYHNTFGEDLAVMS
jgi:hypothetical protein